LPAVRVGPFVLEGADHSLGLAVPARRVGRRGDVPGTDAAEQLGEAPRAGVDERVVGHHGLRRREAELGEVPERAGQAVGVGVGVLTTVLLDVEVAAVVVDDDVHVDPAGATGLVLLGAPHGPVTGHVETRQALDVHVQQRARLAPLIALERLALGAPTTRKPATSEDRVHRRARMADQPGQPSRPEIGPPPRLAEALLLGRRGAPRRSMRPRAAIKRPPARRAVGRRRLPPAPPPPMRDRRRDVQTGRGLPERRAVTDELDQRHATCRSERRPMVLTHPGPPPPGVLADTKRLRTGPDVFTQPFTRSPDRSPSPLPETRADSEPPVRPSGRAGGSAFGCRWHRPRRLPGAPRWRMIALVTMGSGADDPDRTAVAARDAFVGRRRELAGLEGRLGRLANGEGALVLLA